MTIELSDEEVAFLNNLLRQIQISAVSPDALKTMEILQSIDRALMSQANRGILK